MPASSPVIRASSFSIWSMPATGPPVCRRLARDAGLCCRLRGVEAPCAADSAAVDRSGPTVAASATSLAGGRLLLGVGERGLQHDQCLCAAFSIGDQLVTLAVGRRMGNWWRPRRPRPVGPAGRPRAVRTSASYAVRAASWRSIAGVSESSTPAVSRSAPRGGTPARRRPRRARWQRPTRSLGDLHLFDGGLPHTVGRPVPVKYLTYSASTRSMSSDSSPTGAVSVSPAAASSARDRRRSRTGSPRWSTPTAVRVGLPQRGVERLGEHRLHPLVGVIAGELRTVGLDDLKLGLGLFLWKRFR